MSETIRIPKYLPVTTPAEHSALNAKARDAMRFIGASPAASRARGQFMRHLHVRRLAAMRVVLTGF